MELAASDELEIIVSNTTEAGIQYDPSCKKDDCPPSSFPAKLHRCCIIVIRQEKKESSC